MSSPTLHEWIRRLESLSARVLAQTPLFQIGCSTEDERVWSDSFRDEFGHRRSLDPLVLARLLQRPLPAAPARTEPDDILWRASVDGRMPKCPEGSGPITPTDMTQGIELWTQTELAALHAAWNIALDVGMPDWNVRVRSAIDWHVSELQADNATAHPWALHGFVVCAHELDESALWLHADMVLHACLVGTGQPDRFSALLLLDAARGLRRFIERGGGR